MKKKSVKFDKDDRGYISTAKPCHNRKEEKTQQHEEIDTLSGQILMEMVQYLQRHCTDDDCQMKTPFHSFAPKDVSDRLFFFNYLFCFFIANPCQKYVLYIHKKNLCILVGGLSLQRSNLYNISTCDKRPENTQQTL